MQGLTTIFSVIVLIVSTMPLQAQGLRAREVSGGILVEEDTDSVLLFVTRMKFLEGGYARADYIHPLWGLDGGRLTLDFPPDHPHHRGVFWAWRRIFAGGAYSGDSWVCKDFLWDVRRAEVKKEPDSTLTIRVEVYWILPEIAGVQGDEQPVVMENVTIRTYKRQRHYRIIDLGIALKALVKDVRIAGYDNESELSGFSIRLKTPDDLVFMSDSGKLTPRWPAMEAGPWVDISGSFGQGNVHSGIAILTHKDNPGLKDMWNLRQKDSMQNVVFPGREWFDLPMVKDVILKYRLVIHDDHMSAAVIRGLYKAFNAPVR